ncbi:MAG: type II toxin-antitoxin system VapC family toxin [Candidatus Methanoperedens sp.]|nr:type II toxin-antitoxin system VapC family toxin [Candidatus Methanoperedens sp.]
MILASLQRYFSFVEVANVAWKRVAFFKEPVKLMLEALNSSSDFIAGACDVIASKDLLDDAFRIAVSEKITIYDSLFVAASEREKVPLLTTDGKLHEILKWKGNVKLI